MIKGKIADCGMRKRKEQANQLAKQAKAMAVAKAKRGQD